MKVPSSVILLLTVAVSCRAQDNLSQWFLGPKNNSDTGNHASRKDYVSGALQDRAGNLWFGTLGNGLFCYNGKTSKHFTVKNGLPSDKTSPQYEDQQGRIWIGSGGQEYYYDGKTFVHVPVLGADSGHFTYQPADNKSVFITGIYQDKDENMWFAAFDAGVYRYDGKTVTHFQMGELMQGIAADNTGNMWFNFTRYDGKTFNTISPWGHSNSWVMRTLKDKKGNLWFSVKKGGVYRYDGKEFTHYTAKEGLCGEYDEPGFLYEDPSGKIWAGNGGNGMEIHPACLCYFDGQAFQQIPDNSTIRELTNNYADFILGDREGNIWFSSKNLLFRYDGKTTTELTRKIFSEE